MAADAGVDAERFRTLWRSTEADRTAGAVTLEDVLDMILDECGVWDEAVKRKIVEKRINVKRECFKRLHEGIMPMLNEVRRRGYLTAVISNCFSEEAMVIRESEIAAMMDVMMLSYEQKVMKPDREIYRRCVDALGVDARECIYIGDGGSGELEAARDFGMTAMRAVWYMPSLAECGDEFICIGEPMDVVGYLLKDGDSQK
jgi:putative hydrolase of the HAD superfamily